MLIISNFLSENKFSKLNEWTDLGVKNKWLDSGTDRNGSWQCKNRVNTRKYGNRFDYPKIVYDVQSKINKFLNIIDLPKSVIGGGKDGVVVSCTFNGGDVYAHTDPKEGDLEVLRCNIMTRSAESGGELYVGGNKIDINVGDLHCYLPSTIEHYVTEVKGETSRVLWMFGYQCSKEKFKQICNDHKQT
jgi:hypothetical protein